jgi:hypothetical protein
VVEKLSLFLLNILRKQELVEIREEGLLLKLA